MDTHRVRLTAALAAGAAVLAGQLVAAGPASADLTACRLPAPTNVGNEHEGPTDYSRWLEPDGTLRAIVVLVDFPDATATAGERAQRVALLDPAVADWLATSSYGQLSLQLDFTTGWHRMPLPQTEYIGYNSSFDTQRRYMQDAVNAADPAVDFSQYQIVYVLPARSASVFTNSPAFIATVGWGVFADGEELRHGSTLGQDLGSWGPKLVNHETGHVFGLPDLYHYGAVPDLHDAVGGWDLMGLISGPAPDHLAWHKWKLGWLDNSQIQCLTAPGQVTATLRPLGEPGGTKALVIPTGPQRAVVVENRQVSALDVAASCFSPGLLVYTVDSSKAGGDFPVRVIDRTPGSGTGGCHDRDNATLNQPNQQVVDTPSGVQVRFASQTGTNLTAVVSVP